MSRKFYYRMLLGLCIAVPADLFGQTSDSLSHYLEIAARNNPGVQAAFSLYQASLQKIPQAGAWQDPQLEVGFFLKPMEIVGGRQAAQFQLMQMFPWFGTRKTARTEAESMAQMAYEQFREARDQVWLAVYTQWFTLGRLQQQLRNNRENTRLLAMLQEVALQKFAAPDNASAGMSDILLIRLEQAETDNNVESLLAEIVAEKARFNALLNRPTGSDVRIPDSLAPVPFFWDEAAAKEQIKTQNPLLGMLTEEEAAYRARTEADRKMSYPMFGVGLQYMLIRKSSDGMGMEGMNGKDMVMPMVSVTIPVFRGKYRAQQRESALLQQASREKYTDAVNRFEAELYRAKTDLDNAERKIALYRRQSELAQTAYNLTIREFASGKGDLTNILQVQRQLLEYELKTAEAIAVYNITVATIQKLMASDE